MRSIFTCERARRATRGWPPNKLFAAPQYISIPMTITVANDRSSITIEESGQTVTLRPGEWSGWTDFVFPFNPLIKIHGISRFHLIASQPEVKLYLSPINFDPRHLPPGFNISAPPKWAPPPGGPPKWAPPCGPANPCGAPPVG